MFGKFTETHPGNFWLVSSLVISKGDSFAFLGICPKHKMRISPWGFRSLHLKSVVNARQDAWIFLLDHAWIISAEDGNQDLHLEVPPTLASSSFSFLRVFNDGVSIKRCSKINFQNS